MQGTSGSPRPPPPLRGGERRHYAPAAVALRSIFMDGSPRGRAPGRVGPLVIADDGRSAVFVCEPPSAWRRVGRLSLDDGAVTFLDAPLSGNYQRVSTRPEAVFYSNSGPGCGVVDLASGRAAAVEPTPPGYFRACSPGGDLLATEGPRDRRLTISRRDDGAPIAVFDPGLAAFTDDGRFVVAVDQAGDVRALDLRGGGEARFARVTFSVSDSALHVERGGCRVIHTSVRNDSLTLLDPAARTARPLGRWGRRATVRGFARGRCLLEAEDGDARRVVLLDVGTDVVTRLPVAPHHGMVLAPDASFLVCLRGRCFERHDVATVETRSLYDGRDETADALAWSRDGARLASLSASGAVRIVAPDRAVVEWTLETPPSGPAALCFSADGRSLFTCSPRLYASWDLATGAAAVNSTRLAQRAVDMATSADGQWLAIADGARSVRVLDVRGTPRRAATHAVETGLRHIGLAFDTPTAVRVVSWRWDAEGARLEARWLGLEGRPSDAVTLPRDYDHLQVEGAPGAFLTHRGDTILEARRVIGRDRAVTRVVGRLPASDALLCAGAGVAVCLVDRGSTPTLVALCLDDGRELGRAPAPRAPYLARVSPDGRRVAVAYADGGVEVFAIPAPEAP
ncbi:MAG: hypothetical protein U0324_03195 [Polyangiales bacterium]